MQKTKSLIRSGSAWFCFLIIYVITFLLMSGIPGFPLEEALGAFMVLGIFFTSVAYLLVRRYPAPGEPSPVQTGETFALIILFVVVSISLIYGNRILTVFLPASWSTSAALKEVITLTRKLLVFVIVPLFVYRKFFGFHWRDFGFTPARTRVHWGRDLLVLGVLGSLFLLLQWFGGRAAEPIRAGEFNVGELIWGLPFSFLWLFLEVGLVEEFFFRALLQDRITALTRSNSWGIVITALLFGLVHAPGMYFREAGVSEGLGESPTVLSVVGYCIAVQATASLPFAVLWQKTRNIWLVMAVHAMVDLLSNAPDLIRAFR
jgi:membrane protease YdiL (CAAX protease family)